VHLGWNGEVGGGTDLCAVVAQVAAHEDEGVRVGCGSRKPREVADGVARCIEEVE
jgi:hypothetical protein